MTRTTKDPLLLAGKGMAIFMQGAMAIGAIALIISLGFVTLSSGDLAQGFSDGSGLPIEHLPLLPLAGVMLIGLCIVAALYFFFDKLRRIIGTVGARDPFQPANAARLRDMGWLILVPQLLLLPATFLGEQLARLADEAPKAGETHFVFGGGPDLAGLLLVIVLFILARVFRHGAAMREDLEGTV